MTLKKKLSDLLILKTWKQKRIIKNQKKLIKEEEVTEDNPRTQEYEKENPGKHAIWKGKITKQFLAWEEKNYG